MLWRDLDPDPRMLRALDTAGEKPPDNARATLKKNWSEAFANACAHMLAGELRRSRKLGTFEVLPRPDGTTEPVTYTGSSKKRVDVAVTSTGTGLVLGLTLKGGNFVDTGSGYGKNFTGRIYEFESEAREIHQYHPHSVLACVYFLPVASTTDLRERSSFAKLVGMLRSRAGRSDKLSASQFGRLDWAAIGLYSPTAASQGEIVRGACRYFDVFEAPPKNGRPTIDSTLSLQELIEKLVILHRGEDPELEYAEPE